MCSKEEVTFQYAGVFAPAHPCSSDCYYTTSEVQIAAREIFPPVWEEILLCDREIPLDAHANALSTWDFTACECPCSFMVEVVPPSVNLMALSYLAKTLVLITVGINMGFRYVVDFMCDRPK